MNGGGILSLLNLKQQGPITEELPAFTPTADREKDKPMFSQQENTVMTRMIKAPGGVKDKYRNIKTKVNTVKDDNQETIEKFKHLEESMNDLHKVPSAVKL